jgi:hypothetical protein
MSRKEVNRPGLLKALVAGQLTNRQVAGGLRLSVRHVQRLKRRWQAAGAVGLVHRRPGPAVPAAAGAGAPAAGGRLDADVLPGLNASHLTEKLHEVEGLTLCRESVRRIRRALGVPAKQPRRRPAIAGGACLKPGRASAQGASRAFSASFQAGRGSVWAPVARPPPGQTFGQESHHRSDCSRALPVRAMGP